MSPVPIRWFDVADELSATSTCKVWRQGGTVCPPPSRHFFCPSCGVVWMKALVPAPCRHTTVHRRCASCGLGAVAMPFDFPESLATVPTNLLAESLYILLGMLRDDEDILVY